LEVEEKDVLFRWWNWFGGFPGVCGSEFKEWSGEASRGGGVVVDVVDDETEFIRGGVTEDIS